LKYQDQKGQIAQSLLTPLQEKKRKKMVNRQQTTSLPPTLH
jgi:hypothetical protein